MMSLGTLISYGAAAGSFGIACFVLFRAPRVFLHRVFAVGMVAFALEALLTGLSLQAQLPETLIRWQRARLIVGALLPPLWLLFSLSFAQKNEREALKRMRWLLALSFAVPLILSLGLNRHLIQAAVLDESLKWIIALGVPGRVLQAVILVTTVLILMNFERTLRLSKGHLRWQIKFLLIGMGGLFVLRIYTGGQTLLFRSIDMSLEVVNQGALLIAGVLIVRSLLRLKILSIGFYPSHALLYGSFTLILVGIYFIVVGILVHFLKYIDEGQAIALKIFILFLAFLGLSVLLLSDRIRHRIKYWISTHLKRSKYDYRKEWMKFTKQTSMITDPDALCMKAARMISDTLEVLSVTVWLYDEIFGKWKAAGSTVFSGAGIGHRMSEGAGKKLMEVMKDREDPVDLDDPKISWTTDIKESLPDQLEEARIRYCVRLSAGGKFLGLITLGERVGYEPFSFEEFDLLKTMADQIAGSLLHLKLSEELRKTKEMEAFQTISAFMIHDLKNLASTLSLTLQNMPLHFEKPEFREDALQVIKQSVNKVKNLCAQLSLLSKRIELRRVEADLNEVIREALSSIEAGEGITLSHEWGPIPKLPLDPEQIQKVLMNLILNAREALGNGGSIHIQTSQKEGWGVITVSDNGCGMSKEFMEQSLFKPFKTTKKTGMGIGLYQCKMIVEAHGGRIEVESEEGRGSTFRVMLPLEGK